MQKLRGFLNERHPAREPATRRTLADVDSMANVTKTAGAFVRTGREKAVMSVNRATVATMAIAAALGLAWLSATAVAAPPKAKAKTETATKTPAKIEKGKEALYKGEWPYWG